MKRTQGRVAIITGSSKGIGRAIAFGFAERGISLVLAARNGESIRRVANEIVASGGRAVGVACDVSKKIDVKHLVDAAMETHGRIDMLVANAGVLGPQVTVDKILLEEWQENLQINLTGVMLCNQAVLPHMTRQKYGRIQNMGSGLEYQPLRKMAAYAASKGALHSFTRVLAIEVADHNIKVNLHYPGDLQTDMNPRGKGRPEDAVRCALYLAGLPDDGPTGRTFSADQELIFETHSHENADARAPLLPSDPQFKAQPSSGSARDDVRSQRPSAWSRIFRRSRH
jgi:3-oxoacyl-[acyl-carrier protein] reductase